MDNSKGRQINNPTFDAEMQKGECVATVRFWFGLEKLGIFNLDDYIVELDDRHFARVYKRV